MYPSETGRRGERVGQTSRYRCIQCGFPVDARKRTNLPSEAIYSGMVYGDDGSGGVTFNAANGCPHCGSLNWSQKVDLQVALRSKVRPGFKPAGTSFKHKYSRF